MQPQPYTLRIRAESTADIDRALGMVEETGATVDDWHATGDDHATITGHATEPQYAAIGRHIAYRASLTR
jgi:hypothetical protein